MSGYVILSFSVVGALLLLMVLGIAFSIFVPGLDRWHRRYLVALFSIQFVCVALCFIDALIYTDPNMVVFDRIINFLAFAMMSALPIMITIFLLHSCGEGLRKSLLFNTVIGLSVVYLAMLIAAQFTDVF